MKPPFLPPPRIEPTPIVLDAASSPTAIEARSFALIEEEIGPNRPFTGRAWQVARRIVHAGGDLSLLEELVLPPAAVDAGVRALSLGAAVYTDTEMARAGIPMRRLVPCGSSVECFLYRPGVEEEAKRLGSTRAAAGLRALGDALAGSILVVGNAPTALLALLAHLEAGGKAPALVVGMPVGFVNAAESKELLLRRTDLHSLVLRGRRGGSPLAAAAVNALAVLAEEARTKGNKG